MEPVLLLIGVSLTAFAATNLDNLLIVVGLVSHPGQSFAAIVSGVLLASGTIVVLCVAGALVADYIPGDRLGLLGLIPIGLGTRELLQLASRSTATDEQGTAIGVLPALGVTALMLANSADSVAALLPLFAETRKALQPVIGATVLGVAAAGCAVARRLATSAFGPTLRRFAPRITPFVLIAVGLYVLFDTGTDTLRE